MSRSEAIYGNEGVPSKYTKHDPEATDDGTVNVGSTVPAFKYFAIVFRDSPVRRLISRIPP